MNMGVWPTEKSRTRQTNTGTQQRSSSASGRSAQAGTATGFKTTRYSTAQDAANRSSGQSAKQTSGSAGKKPEGTAGSAAGTAAGKPSDPKKDKEKSGESKGGIFGVLVVCALIYLLAGSCDSTDTKTTAATTTKTTIEKFTLSEYTFIDIDDLDVTVRVGKEKTIIVTLKGTRTDFSSYELVYGSVGTDYTEYAYLDWGEWDKENFSIPLTIKGRKAYENGNLLISIILRDAATKETLVEAPYIMLTVKK